MASMDNARWDCRKKFFGRLLKVGLTEFATGLWIYGL